MSNPLVSIIIPVYNGEKFIIETLDSVFAQTYRPIEAIVIDDGSIDKTAEIVKSYQRLNYQTGTQGSLIYIHQKNSGPSKARNTGIKAAKGDYIAFLDADDLWTPMKLERQMEYITSNNKISLVFGDMKVFNDKGISADSSFKKKGYPPCDERGRVLNAFERLVEKNYIPSGTVLLKKKCFENAGYFDESISHGEDYDLWLRIALKYQIVTDRQFLVWRFAKTSEIEKS